MQSYTLAILNINNTATWDLHLSAGVSAEFVN